MLVKDLAEAIGTTASGAGHYLAGRRHPKPGMLKLIAIALDMSVSELIEDDPDFARNEEEKSVLETLRRIPVEQRQAALAMLKALSVAAPPLKCSFPHSNQDRPHAGRFFCLNEYKM